MRNPDVVVIGGGQAGLAMSRSLTAYGIDHIVLERGRIGERWHSERWNSLHLLTTNALSALPGLPHTDKNPDAFMPASAFASYLERYAQKMAAPVICGVEVTDVKPAAGGYRISTNSGQWQTRAVVIATGACDVPYRPAMAHTLEPSIHQMSPADYREPGQLPEGGVLWSAPQRPALNLPRRFMLQGVPWCLPSAITHVRRAGIEDATSTHGWKPRVSLMIQSLKAAISTPLATSHHCNWWVVPTTATSTLEFSATRAFAWLAALQPLTTQGLSSAATSSRPRGLRMRACCASWIG